MQRRWWSTGFERRWLLGLVVSFASSAALVGACSTADPFADRPVRDGDGGQATSSSTDTDSGGTAAGGWGTTTTSSTTAQGGTGTTTSTTFTTTTSTGWGGQGGADGCYPPSHWCGLYCVGNTPATGCTHSTTCTPCPSTAHGTAICTDDGTCAIQCTPPWVAQGYTCSCPYECCEQADCDAGTCNNGSCTGGACELTQCQNDCFALGCLSGACGPSGCECSVCLFDAG